MSSSSSSYVLVHHDQILPCATDAKKWLEESQRGAYTTARTVHNGLSVFELDTHITRLSSTLRLMFDAASEEVIKPETIRPLILTTLRTAITEFLRKRQEKSCSSSSPADVELKLTVLMIWHPPQEGKGNENERLDCFCHVSRLPPLPSPPIKIEIRGAPRHNAKAKDSQWVRDRQYLEALKPADVNEIILHDEDGSLLEGTQTNFYAIRQGKLYTAGEGVLEGTVRRLILQVCQQDSIPVVLTPPRMSEMASWEGCLISSTSRLALPVDWICIPGEGRAFDAEAGDVYKEFKDDYGLAQRISQLVKEQVDTSSTSVM